MPQNTSYGEQPGLDVAIGPVEQAIVPASVHGLAATIAASGNTVSNLLYADGYKALAAGATSTQNGQIQVQRYIDNAGLVAQGAPVTGALSANTPGVVNITDGQPFSSYKVTITNTGGSTATLTNVAILQQAQCMGPSQAASYLPFADREYYGVYEAKESFITSACVTINAYLKRPEGLIWMPDANGMPAWMAALNPTLSFNAPAMIPAGSNVVVTIPNAQFGFQTIGEVVILDRANGSLAEACAVIATSGNTFTLQSVQFSHATTATIEFGLTIMDEKPLPANRPITRTSRTPVARLISGCGRYGYSRRGDQAAGVEFIPTLLPIVQGFGGPPLWVPFNVSDIDINMNTGEMWVPSGLLLAYYTDVRLRYVAGWSQNTVPSDVKQAAANIVRGMIEAPFAGNIKIQKSGDAMLQRFGPESLDNDTKAMLEPYRARLMA